MKQYTESDIKRFYTHVAVASSDKCWPWIGCRNRSGYGEYWHDGRHIKAHRFAFWFSTGTWPGDLLVCHSCDNPSCVNPAHLWLGTHGDNLQDAYEKGRIHVRAGERNGENNGLAKLTNDQVLDMRKRYAAGRITQKQLAAEYGITQATFSCVVNRKTWTHI